MIKKVKGVFRKHFEAVMELKTSPHSIAMGFALGTFLAILPTFGFGVFIGLLLIVFIKDVSKISLFVAFAIWNPLVIAALFPLQYTIGNLIIPAAYRTQFSVEILNQIFFYTGRLFLGSIIMAIVVSMCMYLLVYAIVKKFSEHHKTIR